MNERPPPHRPTRRPALTRAQARARREAQWLALLVRLPPDVRAAIQRPVRLTRGLVWLLALFYIFEISIGMLESPLLMMRSGANVPGLVFEGEWWRLISGNFLHGSGLHLLFNAWALWVLGGVLERVLGRTRLWVLYLLSALGGALSSALFSNALLAVGASTAVFGLLGGLAAVQWRAGERLHPIFRQSKRWWLFILLVNGGLSLLVPQIDAAAHVGGFVTGGALGLWFAGPAQPLFIESRDRALRVFSAALGGLFALGLGWAAWAGMHSGDAQTARMLEAVRRHTDSSGEILNFFAWEVATDAAAGPLSLNAAALTAESGSLRAPAQAEILDTYALLLHRLGRSVEATWLELSVLARLPEAFYATQLLHFATALPVEGPVPTLDLRMGGERIDVAGLGANPLGEWVMVAQVQLHGQTLGTAVLRAPAQAQVALDREGRGRALPESAELVVRFVAPLPPQDRHQRAPVPPQSWRFWPVDEAAQKLAGLPRQAQTGAGSAEVGAGAGEAGAGEAGAGEAGEAGAGEAGAGEHAP